MEATLQVNKLVKNYGKTAALKGISFYVKKGEIYGLIGPNGAGKTTTLRIISTLLKPTSGIIIVMGVDVTREPRKARSLISYLPEEAGAYPHMSGYEYLRLIANIYYDNEEEAEKAVERGVNIAGLGDKIWEKVKSYSKGMKRRLQVARTLMVRPNLALLDEPTSGIDIIHSVHLRNTIKEHARKNGITIVLSSHNMLEVEYLCDRIGFLHRGEIVAEGKPSELIKKYNAQNLEEAFLKVTTK